MKWVTSDRDMRMFVCIASCYQWMWIICNCLKSELCRHCEGSIKIQVMLMQNVYDICFYTADMLWNWTDGRVIKEGEVRHGVITLCRLYNYTSLLHTQCFINTVLLNIIQKRQADVVFNKRQNKSYSSLLLYLIQVQVASHIHITTHIDGIVMVWC